MVAVGVVATSFSSSLPVLELPAAPPSGSLFSASLSILPRLADGSPVPASLSSDSLSSKSHLFNLLSLSEVCFSSSVVLVDIWLPSRRSFSSSERPAVPPVPSGLLLEQSVLPPEKNTCKLGATLSGSRQDSVLQVWQLTQFSLVSF